MMIPPIKGAYLYYDTDSQANVLYLYMKLSNEELKRALPLRYVEDPSNTYLNAFFVNGRDYIGQTNSESILQIINEKRMMNILTHDYSTVRESVNNLIPSEFYYYVSFAQEQLDLSYYARVKFMFVYYLRHGIYPKKKSCCSHILTYMSQITTNCITL